MKYLPPASCLLPSNMPKAEAFIYHQISVSVQQSAFSGLHQKSLIDSSAD